MDKGDDPYSVLGVPHDANESVIKKSYRKLALQHHPDKGGDPKYFAKISNAYEILGDAAERKNYDLQQKHGVCQGYDPRGPRFTTSSNDDDYNYESGFPTSPTATFTPRTPATNRRYTSTTTTSSSSKYPPQQSARNTSTYGGFHDPFEVFRKHFGDDTARGLFFQKNDLPSNNTKCDGDDDHDIMGMSQCTKTGTDPVTGQTVRVIETTYTRADGSTFTKMDSKASSMEHTSLSPQKKKNQKKKSKKKKSKQEKLPTKPTKMVRNIPTILQTKAMNGNGFENDRVDEEENIAGMSQSTQTKTHPNGQRERITTTTFTRFDGSTFTKVASSVI